MTDLFPLRFKSAALLSAGLLLSSLIALSPSAAEAKSTDGSSVDQLFKVPEGSVLLAQAEADDAYDPFADYSEFEQSMDEEEDVNFFRNGRLLTLGFIGGYRDFTQNLGKYYSGNANFGLFLAYFFDLNFALQLGFVTSDHTLVIPATPAGTAAVQGTVSISDISVLLKYYFNTQNVTRGLASLSPYFVGGFSQIYRTMTVSGQDECSSIIALDKVFAAKLYDRVAVNQHGGRTSLA
ncbi:MAG: hypothetical protein EOP06_18390 [Proteobacteria bacterium]|nr:MAG: hypothetical protein EOP06_18390 [Pseudomonadota bacterium]